MSLLAFVTDQIAVRRILDHLGLLRVAEHGDGWGVPAEWGE